MQLNGVDGWLGGVEETPQQGGMKVLLGERRKVAGS